MEVNNFLLQNKTMKIIATMDNKIAVDVFLFLFIFPSQVLAFFFKKKNQKENFLRHFISSV